MAVNIGHQGKVVVGDATVAELDQWSLDVDVKMLETTRFGDTWESKVPGLKSWSGKASGRWDMSDVAGQKALQDALIGGNNVVLKLYVNPTNYYEGTAFIKAISIKASAGDLVEVEFSFEGTGALSYM